MRSLNWTDHANMTKQQQIDLVDIDLKLLRWVSEIVADGSGIRSLEGRGCRLGDGTSRNPKNREILMEQRTKDLAGMIGQVRGFDLNEFLSDWEPAGEALPWTVGDGGWVKGIQQPCETSSAPSAGAVIPLGASGEYSGPLRNFSFAMSGEGVSPTLKVLYVPDYIPMEQRIEITSKLYVQLSQLLPAYNVRLAIAEGPFEDDDGVGAHFEALALQKGNNPAKQIGALKVDLHVSVAKLARAAVMHKPGLIIGHGQGAVVATAYGHPACFEQS